MGFLNWIGNGLRKVGQIGGNVIRGIASIAVPAYRAANNATGGALGHFIEGLPVVGGIAKSIGSVLGNANTMNTAANVANTVSNVGTNIAQKNQ